MALQYVVSVRELASEFRPLEIVMLRVFCPRQNLQLRGGLSVDKAGVLCLSVVCHVSWGKLCYWVTFERIELEGLNLL